MDFIAEVRKLSGKRSLVPTLASFVARFEELLGNFASSLEKINLKNRFQSLVDSILVWKQVCGKVVHMQYSHALL